jgi:hypothetical protein
MLLVREIITWSQVFGKEDKVLFQTLLQAIHQKTP